MNKFIKKLFGITEPTVQTAEDAKQAEEMRRLAAEEKRIASLTPKELATERKEPWVAVLDTHVNKDNVRNGFFELDWNEYFVLQLREAGYKGDSEEAIVDSWFGELCRNVGNESGVNMNQRGSGYINVNNLGDGRTEVS